MIQRGPRGKLRSSLLTARNSQLRFRHKQRSQLGSVARKMAIFASSRNTQTDSNYLYSIGSETMNSILLIDSGALVATALQTTLRRFGLDVELASCCQAAHQRLQKENFDL